MYLPSFNINVSSYGDLFWQLLSTSSDRDRQIVEAGKPVPLTLPVPDKGTKSLFALIIGINAYSFDSEFGPLPGCRKDATDMRNYLLTDLQVPESQIRLLLDDQAKRADIISALQGIQADDRIKKGDPILIFFAGHGGETDAPPGWPTGDPDKKIQMIIPQDYSTDKSAPVHGIPDRSLATLLNGIANRHGDNITVIFDSCHSGSGTRGGRKVRGLPKALNQNIPSDLDSGLWSTTSVVPGPSTAPGSVRRSSHVLLAACNQKEEAGDGGGIGDKVYGGLFTQALLPTLRSTGIDKLTYTSLIQRLDKIPRQSPQCEGLNQDRIIFNSKASPTGRVCFPLRMNGTAYEMQAGAAHGITQGAEFSLYNDNLTIDESTPLCVFVVTSAADILPFTTTLHIKQSSGTISPTLSKTSCVLQTKAGEQEDLLLFAPLDEKLLKLYEKLAAMMKEVNPDKRQIRLVHEREKAILGLSIVVDDKGEEKIVFDNLDSRLTAYPGFKTRMPHTVNNDPGEIIPVLNGAAHFYWHLNREAKNALVNTYIEIECNTLEDSDDVDISGTPFLKATGDNHIRSNVLDIVASDTQYGFKITNHSARDLYVNLFYFNNNDFSIEHYYQSPLGLGDQFDSYPTLHKNGREPLTLGYGSGGVDPYKFSLAEDQDVDVAYLVFFITSDNVNLSSIKQKTPFHGPGRHMEQVKPKQKPVYGTILVPIVVRRTPLKSD